MSDLVEWLTKILDEDEATAHAALDLSKVHIPTSDGYELRYYWMRELQLSGKMQSGWTMNAVFTPEQALADIAAKRAIIGLHDPVPAQLGPHHPVRACSTCGYATGGVISTYPCLTLRLVASAYADRPGYDESWRP